MPERSKGKKIYIFILYAEIGFSSAIEYNAFFFSGNICRLAKQRAENEFHFKYSDLCNALNWINNDGL